MSDPGDKSDDLISELARLMASSASGARCGRQAHFASGSAQSNGHIRRSGSDSGDGFGPGGATPGSDAAARARLRGPFEFPVWTSRHR